MSLNEALLIKTYPLVCHMAEGGSWPLIGDHGLWSTSKLLDLFGYEGAEREEIESRHRRGSFPITSRLGHAVIRDQLPMSDEALTRCLPTDMTPSDWYRLLNERTFFWPTEKRLNILLGAGPYKDRAHDILIVDTATLLERHRHHVSLSRLNSGCTRPFPHPRDRGLFQRIDDFPLAERLRKRGQYWAVAELAVDHGIPDIADIVVRVESRSATTNFGVIVER